MSSNLHARLADELRGQTMVVPNMLGDLLDGWLTGAFHPHYTRLKHVLEGILESSVPEGWYRNKLKESDFARFTCIWYPDATWEDLHTMGLLGLWAFVWDDTFDTGEQELADDYEQGTVFRAQTLAYCRYWLGLESFSVKPSDCPAWPSCSPPPSSSSSRWRKSGGGSENAGGSVLGGFVGWLGYRALPPPPPNAACAIFKPLGETLAARFDKKQRRRIYLQIKFWIDSTAEEQRLRIQGSIPTYDDYMRIRQGTTAFRIFALIGEVAVKTDIPSSILDSPEMSVAMAEANVIIIIINDILSLKKEMATLCMINLVPIMYHHGEKSLETIITTLTAELKASRQRFETAEGALRQMALRHDLASKDDKLGKTKMQDGLRRFIDSLKYSAAGTWDYTVTVPRYGIQKCTKPDGTVEITL